jgi:MFS superfamily sulfate permease-like transporter
MLPYTDINIDAPVSDAFGQKGLTWARFVISLGAMTGITSVLLVLMLSQPRVLLAMARDGLLPHSFFGAVHERFRTPWKSTILTGIVVSIMGALLPLGVLADLTNIGTLLAFVIVCAAVLILRKTHPDAERPFPGAFRASVPRPRDLDVPSPHVFAAARELGPPRGVARNRPADLSRIRKEPQRHGKLSATRGSEARPFPRRAHGYPTG